MSGCVLSARSCLSGVTNVYLDFYQALKLSSRQAARKAGLSLSNHPPRPPRDVDGCDWPAAPRSGAWLVASACPSRGGGSSVFGSRKRSCVEVSLAPRRLSAPAAAEMDESAEQMKPLLRTVSAPAPRRPPARPAALAPPARPPLAWPAGGCSEPAPRGTVRRRLLLAGPADTWRGHQCWRGPWGSSGGQGDPRPLPC